MWQKQLKIVYVTVLFFLMTGCIAISALDLKTPNTVNTEPLRVFISSATSPEQDPTHWPTKVDVRKPDPILGNTKVLEIWSYDKHFAERFYGFPIEHVEPNMPEGLHAVVLRVYLESYAPFYKEALLYSCAMELFTNNNVPIQPTKFIPDEARAHILPD
jgi:hypothetical protein